jgi:hypothetical protein
MIQPSMSRRAVGWLAYVLGVLLFFEAGARLALGNETLFRRLVLQDEASWRLRWIRRRAVTGSMQFSFDQWSPTLGWKPRPNVHDAQAFGGKLLTTNARGLRGSRNYAYEKPEGVFRIVVLGDSFTFGEEVGDDDAYPHQLEARLPGVEVINLGVHGYGHDQMLLYLKEEGLRYHPDLVLLGFISDDMVRNVLAFRDYAKPRFELDGGRLVLRQASVPPPEAMLAREPWRSRLFDVLTMLRAAYRNRYGQQYREAQQLTLALLDEMRATTEASGARPVFAYLPVYGELTKPDLPKTLRERFFFGYCAERGIASVYLRPYFLEAMKKGVELKVYGHWGPVEHRVAAEGLAAELLARGIVPKPRAP